MPKWLIVSCAIFFSSVTTGFQLLKALPQPLRVIWQILASVGKTILGIAILIAGGMLTAGLTKPLWKKADSFHLPSMKKEIISFILMLLYFMGAIGGFGYAVYGDAKLISVAEEPTNFLASNPLSDTNELTLYLQGNDERMTLISVFDNLGKGASGAAVQNMNIVLGLDETTGLI